MLSRYFAIQAGGNENINTCTLAQKVLVEERMEELLKFSFVRACHA